jgi:hypothetical protein
MTRFCVADDSHAHRAFIYDRTGGNLSERRLAGHADGGAKAEALSVSLDQVLEVTFSDHTKRVEGSSEADEMQVECMQTNGVNGVEHGGDSEEGSGEELNAGRGPCRRVVDDDDDEDD